jgi:hypothetical protein
LESVDLKDSRMSEARREREREEDIDFDDIEVDCYTTENFFLRRYSNVKEANQCTKIECSFKRVMECCLSNRNRSEAVSTTKNVASSINNLIFRFIIDDTNASNSSKLSSSSSMSGTIQTRRQVDNCVILALKEVRQNNRKKTEDSVFVTGTAVNCMGGDGVFMKRFTDVYQTSRLLKLETSKLINALLVKNTLYNGFYWGYYQGNDDVFGSGEGEVCNSRNCSSSDCDQDSVTSEVTGSNAFLSLTLFLFLLFRYL